MQNTPELWLQSFPVPGENDHKYSRGQVAVLGGMEMTGASCLAAHAASRIGAGYVIIVSPTFEFLLKDGVLNPTPIYRSFMPHLIVREGMSFMDYVRQAERKGVCIPLIGPGLGTDDATIRRIAITAMKRGKPVILDADALNAFEGHFNDLLSALHLDVIITPHEGEFRRLFPDLKDKPREEAILLATEKVPCVIVLKGAQTLIARHGQEVVVNTISSPYLASAGTGDVLSGMIAGLCAQGMSVFEAACAGVWAHGRAGQISGPGLIAGDLPLQIPQILQEVLGFKQKLS